MLTGGDSGRAHRLGKRSGMRRALSVVVKV